MNNQFKKTYENGLKLVFEKNNKDVISLNIMFAVGSQNEQPNQEGFAHFIEHLIFKGTKSLSTEEIMDKLTFLGADYNAYTSKTSTKYILKCLPENFEECFKIYADMLLNAEFKPEEIDKERQVVVEEMKRSDDDPLDVLYKRVMDNYFAGLSFAHDELGTEKIIENVARKELLEFKNKYYKAENCIISVVGNLDFNKLDKMVETYFASHFKYKSNHNKAIVEPFKINISKKYDIVERNDNQANVCLHIKSVSNLEKEKFAANIYASILGNSQNSLLFKTIRERLGLVYSIGAYNEIGLNSGEMLIVFGTRPKNVKKAICEIKKVICNLAKDGVSEIELERTKNWKKSCMSFGLEANTDIADVNCNSVYLYDKCFNFEERKKQIEAVSVADVNAFAKRIADEKQFNVVAVGKNLKIEDLQQF